MSTESSRILPQAFSLGMQPFTAGNPISRRFWADFAKYGMSNDQPAKK